MDKIDSFILGGLTVFVVTILGGVMNPTTILGHILEYGLLGFILAISFLLCIKWEPGK